MHGIFIMFLSGGAQLALTKKILLLETAFDLFLHILNTTIDPSENPEWF